MIPSNEFRNKDISGDTNRSTVGGSSRLEEAYDAERFRETGHRLIDMLADYLAETTSGRAPQVLPWLDPDEALEHWQSLPHPMPPEELFRQTLERSVRIHHPKFMGHQISPPLPIASLTSFVVDMLNNGMGIYEMGMPGAVMERVVMQQVAEMFGMGEGASGFLTSGGTLANMTALLTARRLNSSEDIWQKGHTQPAAVLVSQEAHYCIDRAARVMGWGANGTIPIEVDHRYRMRIDRLEEAYRKAKEEGTEVVAVVGSACTTSTGSYDDLVAIGEFCRQHDLWFHVDGAHGAAAAFSTKYRSLLRGLEMADSVVIDFHKMLLAPALTSGLLFRQGRDGYQTFSQRAQYLLSQHDQETEEWYNLARRTFECTKSMMVMKIYAILAVHGAEILDESVTRLTDLAKRFAQLIEAQESMELAVQPSTNIVCFRYRGELEEEETINDLNAAIRREIVERGEYYLVQTTLGSNTWLRTTLANPLTTEKELTGLLATIEETASAIAERN